MDKFLIYKNIKFIVFVKTKLQIKKEVGIILKTNKIYNIDCMKGMKLIKDSSVDLVSFDPPFNLNKYYGEGIKDNMRKDEYLKWQYSLLDEAIRILKPTGAIVYHNMPKWAFKVANYLDEKKMVFQNWICWAEGSHPSSTKLFPKHYAILWFSKSKTKTFNKQYIPVKRCRVCNNTIKNYGGKYKKMKEINGEKVVVLTDVWDDIHRVKHKKINIEKQMNYQNH